MIITVLVIVVIIAAPLAVWMTRPDTTPDPAYRESDAEYGYRISKSKHH